MKLFFDPKNITYECVLNEYQPTVEGAIPVLNFCNEGLTHHETIGGVFWVDNENQQHYVELKTEKLIAILYVVKALALRQPINISYMNEPASKILMKAVFGYNSWVIRFAQFIRLIPKTKYNDCFTYLDKYPRNNIHKAVCKQQ
jgi:hypothetical protein